MFGDAPTASSAGFLPSSALLRSVMINGAAPMGGTLGSKGPSLDAPPNHVQGYGRLQLTTSIKVITRTRRCNQNGRRRTLVDTRGEQPAPQSVLVLILHL